MLAQMHDLSPDCSATNFYCGHFDHAILDLNGWPDLIIEGPYHGDFAWTDEFLAAATAKGIPIIRLTSSYSTEDAPTRGYLEIAQRFEDLARALGADAQTAPDGFFAGAGETAGAGAGADAEAELATFGGPAPGAGPAPTRGSGPAGGGGEGGFGVRVVQDGKFGFAHLVDVSGAERAVGAAVPARLGRARVDVFALDARRGDRRHPHERERRFGGVPVSYTHLTLPTKA